MTQVDSNAPPRLTPIALSYALIVGILVMVFFVGLRMATGVRGFVGGESSWSKAQKQATACLQRYAVSHVPADYECYLSHREVITAATNAREELSRADPDDAKARAWLVAAGADAEDTPAMAMVFERFRDHHLMRGVISSWVAGDSVIAEMDRVALQVRARALAGDTADTAVREALLREIRDIDSRLTVFEDRFSRSLRVSARYIGGIMTAAILACGALLFALGLFIATRWIGAWGRTQEEARQRAERMRAVADAAAGVSAASTIEELDAVLRSAISRVIETDYCTFGTYDAEAGVFSFLPGTVDGVQLGATDVRIKGTPSERFLQSRASLLTHTSTDARGAGAVVRGNGRRSESVIRTPVYSQQRLLGLISVQSYTPHHYTPDDVEVVEALGAVTASAIERIESARRQHAAEEDLRRSQEQLAQAHKMEAVGLLAGGVAHDFNNLLTAIRGNSDLLRDDASLPADLRDHVEEIGAAADRAAALTGQLLAFSRRQVLQPRVVDLNSLVRDMGSFLRRLIDEDVTMVTSLDPELGHVRADPHQLEQVILNLALNARDAMPQRGTLTIETSNVELDASVANLPSITPGSYIRLSVRDSGIGMSDEDRKRIFEPFYTTKGVGKGTGLGLSTVYGIVKQSGGHIFVDSAPGAGTNMQIFLPRTMDPLDAPLKESSPPRVVPMQKTTIMVVEDETTVRTLLTRVLKREGYEVIEAGSGEEALAILSSSHFDVDLLLTDTVMPGMSGVALAQRASAMRPELAVLHMSGYTEDEVFRRGLSSGGQAFLQKPFTPAVLLSAVVDALTYAARPTG